MSASIKTWISVAGALAISGCIYAEPSKSFNNSDICAILQLTIDLPNLQQYFHVSESPDGKPLKMVINDDFDKNCINLKKFSEPVVFIDKQSASASRPPYLEVTKIEFINNDAQIIFLYGNRGDKGYGEAKKEG